MAPQDLDVIDGGTILSPETVKLIAAGADAGVDRFAAELEAQGEPVHETHSGGDRQKPPASSTPTQLEFDF